MPDISGFHTTIVFVHIVGVFIFLLAHGVSAGVLLRLRGERDLTAVRTLLDLSRRSWSAMALGLLLWFFGGILAGFSGNYWTTGRYWIWASLVVAIATVLLMTPLGAFYLNRVREAAGVDVKTGSFSAAETIDQAALEAAISSGRPVLVATLGLGAIVVLAWLMILKPF
jgi:hypothetical protein